MANFALVPWRTALVNVDMQNCFVHGSPISAPDGLIVQERINRVAAACRAAGILVIHASHVLRADGSNAGLLNEIGPLVKEGIINKVGVGRAAQGLGRRSERHSPRKTAFRRLSRN
jgi:nicotinamidase-related amidase